MSTQDRMNQEVEQYLEGDSELSRLYRSASREEPDARLDEKILEQARQHAAHRPHPAHSPFSRNWMVPVSLAAVLVMSVSVVLLMTGERPALVEGETEGYSRPPPTAKQDALLEEEPSPPLKEPVTAGKGVSLQEAMPFPHPKPMEKKGRRLTTPSAPPFSIGGKPARDASARFSVREKAAEARKEAAEALAPLEGWLEQIAALWRQGRHREAERQLDAFRNQHPNYNLEVFLGGLKPPYSDTETTEKLENSSKGEP